MSSYRDHTSQSGGPRHSALQRDGGPGSGSVLESEHSHIPRSGHSVTEHATARAYAEPANTPEPANAIERYVEDPSDLQLVPFHVNHHDQRSQASIASHKARSVAHRTPGPPSSVRSSHRGPQYTENGYGSRGDMSQEQLYKDANEEYPERREALERHQPLHRRFS